MIGPDLARVRAAIAVGVLQNENLVLRFLAGHDLWIRHRGADPQAPTRIPPNTDRLDEIREVFLAHEAVHLEARVNLEGLQFVCRAEPFVDRSVAGDRGEWIGVSVVSKQRSPRNHLSWIIWFGTPRARELCSEGIGCFAVHLTLNQNMDRLVTNFHHALQLLQFTREVHHAIRLLASARDVVAIERAVATEELLVLLFHHSPHIRVHLWRCFVEQTVVKRFSKGAVAGVIQVDGVVVKMARYEL